MALSLVYCMLRQNTPTGNQSTSDQPILDLRRAQESLIRRYNSNSARDPPTELLAFRVSYLRFRPLKVVSAILGRNINDHIHLIFPHDPLAGRLISLITNHRQGAGVVGFFIQ